MAQHWIAGAIRHPGALTKKAMTAHMDTMAYAHKMADAPGTTGKQARLAMTLRRMRKKKTLVSGGD